FCFSSRRRHTRLVSDWSSDVCSSDLITNAGNHARESMAAMIQQDLKKIGIRLNVVTLDFNSLLERITQTYNYEACLLGSVNADRSEERRVGKEGRSRRWAEK